MRTRNDPGEVVLSMNNYKLAGSRTSHLSWERFAADLSSSDPAKLSTRMFSCCMLCPHSFRQMHHVVDHLIQNISGSCCDDERRMIVNPMIFNGSLRECYVRWPTHRANNLPDRICEWLSIGGSASCTGSETPVEAFDCT